MLVVSLRAGGRGLNLPAANHVFHFDRWWNPAVEQQATDRAHRLGQEKPVCVHSLICTGTLEERIDQLLESKRELVEKVMAGTSDDWLGDLDLAAIRAAVCARARRVRGGGGVMGPWARAFLDRYRQAQVPGTAVVEQLRIDPSLITARVDGRPVTLSASPIPQGIWAAIDGQVTPGRQSEDLVQLLDHTWEEPLLPHDVVSVGAADDVAAVVRAVADEIERDPATLLRWRGFAAGLTVGDEAWRGGELPPLPPPARRPPESVPKRFGASGIVVGGEDVVETLIRAYRAFGS